MRVALINYCPSNTGIGRYTLALQKFMKESGVEADHYYMDKSDRCLYLNPDQESKLLRRIKKNILFDNFLFSKLYLSNLILDYRLARAIPRNYDLYHITGARIAELNLFTRIRPNVVTVHDLIYRIYAPDYRYKILDKIIQFGSQRGDLIITEDNPTKDEIMEHYHIPEEKIRIIPLGVESRFMPLSSQDTAAIYTKYGLDNNCRYILHVGKGPTRDVITLVKAFHKLISDFNISDVKLLKVGMLDDASRDEITRSDLNDRVKLVEYSPEEDLPKFYNIADIFVSPSLYKEFSLPSLEAMACGTPVLTTNVPSLPEILEKYEIPLKIGNIDSFTQAMYKVLTNDALRQELATGGLDRAREFSWKKTTDETLKAYKELIGK